MVQELYIPALSQVVNRRQPSRQMIRRLICCRCCDTKANVLRRSCHGWNDSQRLVDWPLRTGHNRWFEVSRALVDVVAT